MGNATRVLKMTSTAPILLLLSAVLILALGGCGDEDTSSGGGGEETTSSAEAGGEAGGGEETTSSAEAGGQTGGEAGGATVPADMVGAILELTPSQDSGVSGTATVSNTDAGALQVILNMQGLTDEPGTEHPAHIHEGGTCSDDRAGNGAPVQYPLTTLSTGSGGTALSTTVIEDVTLPELSSGTPRYINVHAAPTGEGTPPGISCADLS